MFETSRMVDSDSNAIDFTAGEFSQTRMSQRPEHALPGSIKGTTKGKWNRGLLFDQQPS